jgi:hypothetical protein
MSPRLNNNAKQFLLGRYSYVLTTLRFAILLLSRASSPSQRQLLAAFLVICARTGLTLQ